MKNCGLPFFFLLVLAIAITLACGSPVSHISPNCSFTPTGSNTTGILQSITLCPAAADARDYPGGQIQFIASGYYSAQPSPVTPLQAGWGVCQQDNPTTAVSVTSSGLAQCEAGASGEYSVFASDPGDPTCLVIGPCGTGCFVSGYAKLTCP